MADPTQANPNPGKDADPFRLSETSTARIFERFRWEGVEQEVLRSPLVPAEAYFRHFPWEGAILTPQETPE